MDIDHDAGGLARFLSRIGALKRTKRTGWLDRGVPAAETESVADHSWRVALLAWLAAAGEPGLDRERVLKLALVHDLAEAVTGDLLPYDPALAPEHGDAAARVAFLQGRHVRSDERRVAKRAAEAAAMADLLADLPARLAEELGSLWRELEDAATAEARFVKQADKVETYLQSREYAAGRPDLPVASFAAEVAAVIEAGPLVDLRDAIGATDWAVEEGGGGRAAGDVGRRADESERDSSPRSE